MLWQIGDALKKKNPNIHPNRQTKNIESLGIPTISGFTFRLIT